MYNRLTVAYSTLCRENDSPLSVEWQDEAGGLDARASMQLKEIFERIQPAFVTFCMFTVVVHITLVEADWIQAKKISIDGTTTSLETSLSIRLGWAGTRRDVCGDDTASTLGWI